MTDALSALAAEKFVSLTTFKKDGTPVAAPMWIGRDGDHLFVWTPADSWKAKRAKNNPGSCWCHAAVLGRSAKALSRWMASPK